MENAQLDEPGPVTFEDARRYALSLPETSEEPHHHLTSFRVRGKIFATAPADGEFIRLFVAEEDRQRAIAIDPGACKIIHWGKNAVGVEVSLPAPAAYLVNELLDVAWRRKAPKKLLSELDKGTS